MNIIVNSVADGTPSARTCLLHQKLQLLNCCIKRALDGKNSVTGNSSEDEFFDCSEGEGEETPIWDRPVGRLERLGEAMLKNGAPLYVPRTQVCITIMLILLCYCSHGYCNTFSNNLHNLI